MSYQSIRLINLVFLTDAQVLETMESFSGDYAMYKDQLFRDCEIEIFMGPGAFSRLFPLQDDIPGLTFTRTNTERIGTYYDTTIRSPVFVKNDYRDLEGISHWAFELRKLNR